MFRKLFVSLIPGRYVLRFIFHAAVVGSLLSLKYAYTEAFYIIVRERVRRKIKNNKKVVRQQK